MRVLPHDVLKAREALTDAGLQHVATDVLEVILPHRPGALASMTRILADEQVFVRYAYCTIMEGSEQASCVLQVDDIHKAEKVLNLKLQ